MEFVISVVLGFLARWAGEGFFAVAKSIDQFMGWGQRKPN